MSLSSLLKIVSGITSFNCRYYAFKSDLKYKWIRPRKIPFFKPEKTGDCLSLPEVGSKQYMLGYKDSTELKSADSHIQNLFLLANNRKTHSSKYHKTILVKGVQRHFRDYGSIESKIAKMTFTINGHQQIMECFPKNVGIKVQLKELIDKRKKYLKYLRRWDYKRFEWLLENLRLIYKPPPSEFHWITRKKSLQNLTDAYCESIKNHRLKTFQTKLESQQTSFLDDAIKKMQRISLDQSELNLTPPASSQKIHETILLLAKPV